MSNFEAQFHRYWPCGCGTSTGECAKHAAESDRLEERRPTQAVADCPMCALSCPALCIPHGLIKRAEQKRTVRNDVTLDDCPHHWIAARCLWCIEEARR